MKKSLLTLGLAAFALTSFGATRVLYEQNFETVSSVEETGWGWTDPAAGGTAIEIGSDSFGKYLEIKLGGSNGRSAQLTWGPEIFLDKDGNTILDGDTYTVQFDFAIAAGSTNQYNGEFTVFTNHAPIANNKYFLPWSQKLENSCWQNWLIDMNQQADSKFGFDINGSFTEVTDSVGAKTGYAYDASTAESMTFTEAMWYTVKLDVNVTDRTVDWSIISLDYTEEMYGTYTVPEADVNGDAISMYAEGIFCLLARYQTIYQIDNIKVWFESTGDWANPPTIALTRLGRTADDEINLNLRAYTITFGEDETLHVVGTDGKTETADYADCEGAYVYETTTSGTLKAWTTLGTATSEEVVATVDCTPVALPSAVATISSVSEGYGKTFTLTVSNSETPLRPTIFIDYKFTGKDGNVIEKTGEASGVKVEVPSEGVLSITTKAGGYVPTTISVDNDIEFKTKKTWDFARMTKDEITAALSGCAWETLNSGTTSGFSNWTARKRLYYNVEGTESVTDDGKTVWETYLPFGFVSTDSETQVMEWANIDQQDAGETVDNVKDQYFPGLTIFPATKTNRNYKDKDGRVWVGAPNVGMIYRVGLMNNQTINNYNNVIIHDLSEDDFVVVNYINDYGSNSVHPICSTADEYYAQLAGDNTVIVVAKDGTKLDDGTYDATYALYRIDTAITKITVFTGEGAGVEGVEAAVEGDNYWYTIQGIRVAEPTQPGLYIHNGKKVVVK